MAQLWPRTTTQRVSQYLILCLVIGLAAVTTAPVAVAETLITRAQIAVNKSRVIETDLPYTQALVAGPEIADVVPLTDQTFYVLGKKLGSTRVVVTDATKEVISIVEVEVTPDLGDLRRKLSSVIRGGQIRVTSANGGLLLTGHVRHAVDVNKAVAIAERYAPDAVTNALSVTSPQQVMLEVRFVEATRRAARELGVSTRIRSGRNNADIGPQTFSPGEDAPIISPRLLSGAEPFGTLISRIIDSGTKVDVIIRALEERLLARRLAEPNLTTLSGSKANFLAGGEFPFPVGADDNRISIEFKKFGVALDFTPTVLANGQINLQIAPEVSELDPEANVEVGGVRIPGISVRRASTVVELADGQSLAIAGLLQQRSLKAKEQLPWLGTVPVLGALFRSAQYLRRETDLVIIVTPRLVKPKVPGEQLRTPADTSTPTNDLEFFVTGRLEIESRAKRRGYGPAFGHIITVN
ncbi:MAG: type II and III secretion system protein family protein [Pseudomonadota bacterium]